MALYYVKRNTLNVLRFLALRHLQNRKYNDQIVGNINLQLEQDVIDDFTSHLIQQKLCKWEEKKNQWTNSTCSCNEEKVTNLDDMKMDEIITMFHGALDVGNSKEVMNLMKQCMANKKYPPIPIVLNVLSLSAQNGNVEIIDQIKELIREFSPSLLEAHADFQYFTAEAIWVKGNIPKSLELFETVYSNNTYLRRTIRLVLKNLISTAVVSRSEAVMMNIIGFCERICAGFADYYPLVCVWQSCFLSEWFSDQCIALDLLERNNGLREAVMNKIPYVVFVSLQCHRAEVVYRLLEILLTYKMVAQYANVLVALLDYQFRNGDYQSCIEIIQWSIENKVELPGHHHVQLINLLLNQRFKIPLAKFKCKPSNTYDLKF